MTAGIVPAGIVHSVHIIWITHKTWSDHFNFPRSVEEIEKAAAAKDKRVQPTLAQTIDQTRSFSSSDKQRKEITDSEFINSRYCSLTH